MIQKEWEVLGGVTGSDAYKAVSYLKLVQEIAKSQGGATGDILFPPNNAYPALWVRRPIIIYYLI